MSETPVEILLVEDNENDIVLIQEAFAEAATARLVAVVRDGEEAMAYLGRRGRYQDARMPGLVLLDINMPRKNGFEVLAEMKADPVLQCIPVVIFSGSTQQEDIARSYAAGAATYVPKPMDFQGLIEFAQAF
jgi:CheY-like chemotaxis protein